jgi:CHAT domain-containing protein
MRPALASIAEIQALLDADTVLLAYTFGVTHGWGWAVTRNEVHAFPVAPLAPIDAAARRVLDGVRRPARAATPEPAAGLPGDIAALSAMVLGPIAERLDGDWRGSRLAIVASGPLEYVPFAALSLPAGGEAGAARTRWLGQEHEVVLLPSASVLAILREPGQARRTPTGGLVVVADPVYSPGDPRVRRQTTRRDQGAMRTASAAGPVPVLPTSWRRTRGDGSADEFARLLFSRQEARALAQMAGPLGAVQALDFDASLETFKSRTVAGARLVHVATHGILDAVQPERSGLVLSLVDRQGRPRDGVLRLDDIFGLSLSADLVVLSGCETGLGRQMRGEGLVGLTRAFMYAGAPRIVPSLWQVDDQATAQLMTRLYRHMLQRGERPAAALRAAQMALARDPRWAAPYFWAGFVLHGDWR